MADTASAVTSRPPHANGSGPGGPRQVRPSRRLPGGRAVVGGFLVAASAVGVFSAYTAANRGPTGSYAVVTADVGSGQRISAADLALVPLDLPPDQRRLAFAGLDLLEGSVALAPLAAGQLVQVSDVAKPAGGAGRAQISVAVDPGRALGGDPDLLGAGERVAVIVTYTSGGQPVTSTVSDDAVVVRTLGGGEQVGGGGALTVVLAVPPGELEPIAEAAAAGVVTLARNTGLAPPVEGGR